MTKFKRMIFLKKKEPDWGMIIVCFLLGIYITWMFA